MSNMVATTSVTTSSVYGNINSSGGAAGGWTFMKLNEPIVHPITPDKYSLQWYKNAYGQWEGESSSDIQYKHKIDVASCLGDFYG